MHIHSLLFISIWLISTLQLGSLFSDTFVTHHLETQSSNVFFRVAETLSEFPFSHETNFIISCSLLGVFQSFSVYVLMTYRLWGFLIPFQPYHYFLLIFPTIFFVPCLVPLLRILTPCLHYSANDYVVAPYYTSQICWNGDFWGYWVVSILLLPILFSVNFLVILVYFQYVVPRVSQPHDLTLHACSTMKPDTQFFVFKTGQFMLAIASRGQSSFRIGLSWCSIAAGLFYVKQRWKLLPYWHDVSESLYIFSGLLLTLFGACSFLHAVLNQLDATLTILYAGVPLIALTAIFIVKHRIQSTIIKCSSQITTEDEAELYARCRLRQFYAYVNSYSGNYLDYTDLNDFTEAQRLAYDDVEMALELLSERFPSSASLLGFCTQFYFTVRQNKMKAYASIELAHTCKYNLVTRFHLRQFQYALHESASRDLDYEIRKYTECQERLHQVKEGTSSAAMCMTLFWAELSSTKPGLDQMVALGTEAKSALTRTCKNFDRLLELNPFNVAVLRAYARFTLDQLGDYQRSLAMLSVADAVECKNENTVLDVNYGLFLRKMTVAVNIHDEKNAIISMSVSPSKFGEILTANNTASEVLGFSNSELVGHNINVILPHPIKETHDMFLHQYLKKRVSNVVNHVRMVLAVHKLGYLQPFVMYVRWQSEEKGTFVSVLKPLHNDYEVCAMLDLNGTVKYATRNLVHVFGLNKRDLASFHIKMEHLIPQQQNEDPVIHDYYERQLYTSGGVRYSYKRGDGVVLELLATAQIQEQLTEGFIFVRFQLMDITEQLKPDSVISGDQEGGPNNLTSTDHMSSTHSPAIINTATVENSTQRRDFDDRSQYRMTSLTAIKENERSIIEDEVMMTNTRLAEPVQAYGNQCSDADDHTEDLDSSREEYQDGSPSHNAADAGFLENIPKLNLPQGSLKSSLNHSLQSNIYRPVSSDVSVLYDDKATYFHAMGADRGVWEHDYDIESVSTGPPLDYNTLVLNNDHQIPQYARTGSIPHAIGARDDYERDIVSEVHNFQRYPDQDIGLSRLSSTNSGNRGSSRSSHRQASKLAIATSNLQNLIHNTRMSIRDKIGLAAYNSHDEQLIRHDEAPQNDDADNKNSNSMYMSAGHQMDTKTFNEAFHSTLSPSRQLKDMNEVEEFNTMFPISKLHRKLRQAISVDNRATNRRLDFMTYASWAIVLFCILGMTGIYLYSSSGMNSSEIVIERAIANGVREMVMTDTQCNYRILEHLMSRPMDPGTASLFFKPHSIADVSWPTVFNHYRKDTLYKLAWFDTLTNYVDRFPSSSSKVRALRYDSVFPFHTLTGLKRVSESYNLQNAAVAFTGFMREALYAPASPHWGSYFSTINALGNLKLMLRLNTVYLFEEVKDMNDTITLLIYIFTAQCIAGVILFVLGIMLPLVRSVESSRDRVFAIFQEIPIDVRRAFRSSAYRLHESMLQDNTKNESSEHVDVVEKYLSSSSSVTNELRSAKQFPLEESDINAANGNNAHTSVQYEASMNESSQTAYSQSHRSMSVRTAGAASSHISHSILSMLLPQQSVASRVSCGREIQSSSKLIHEGFNELEDYDCNMQRQNKKHANKVDSTLQTKKHSACERMSSFLGKGTVKRISLRYGLFLIMISTLLVYFAVETTQFGDKIDEIMLSSRELARRTPEASIALYMSMSHVFVTNEQMSLANPYEPALAYGSMRVQAINALFNSRDANAAFLYGSDAIGVKRIEHSQEQNDFLRSSLCTLDAEYFDALMPNFSTTFKYILKSCANFQSGTAKRGFLQILELYYATIDEVSTMPSGILVHTFIPFFPMHPLYTDDLYRHIIGNQAMANELVSDWIVPLSAISLYLQQRDMLQRYTELEEKNIIILAVTIAICIISYFIFFRASVSDLSQAALNTKSVLTLIPADTIHTLRLAKQYIKDNLLGNDGKAIQ